MMIEATMAKHRAQHRPVLEDGLEVDVLWPATDVAVIDGSGALLGLGVIQEYQGNDRHAVLMSNGLYVEALDSCRSVNDVPVLVRARPIQGASWPDSWLTATEAKAARNQ